VEYRVIYDVREDAWPWLSAAPPLLIGLLAVLCYGRRGGRAPDEPPAGWRPSRWLLPLLGLTFLYFAWNAADAFLGHSRCRGWAEAGQYEVTEGRAADYRSYGKPSSESFRVEDFAYDGSAGRAGYRGRFTAPGVRADALRDGASIRVAHRSGCILRIEVAP
jgi:hypothetical protein